MLIADRYATGNPEQEMKTSTQLERLSIYRTRSQWTWCLDLLMCGAGCLISANASAQLESTGVEPSWIPYLEAGFDTGDEISGASVTSSSGVNSSGTNSFDHSRLRFAATRFARSSRAADSCPSTRSSPILA